MKNYLICFCLMTSGFGFSQNIGINSTGVNPLASAMLDVSSDDKGVLIPRLDIVDLTTALPVVLPETSLLVYNTNTTTGVGYYYWDANKWNRIYDQTFNAEDHDWYKVGSTESPDDITDDIFTQGKVGVGVIAPTSKLEISDAFNGDVSVLKLRNSIGSGLIRTGVAIDFHHFGNVNVNSQILSQQNAISGFHANLIFLTEEGNVSPTGLQERMRIGFDGKIGINEPTPQARLDVNGDVRIQSVGVGSNADDFLVTDANGILKSAPIVTNVTDGGANLRMYTGHSPADGTGWVSYLSNGLYIDIDISACGFTSPPQIFTTMGGGAGSWVTTGNNSTYDISATSFRIYINYMNSAENNIVPTPAIADANNWYINWFAIGN